MKKFLNGIARALSVMAVCALAGCSSPSGGSTPSGNGNQNPPSIDYGNTSDPKGTKVIASWMNAYGNIKIGSNAIAKTSEVVAVPKGSVAEITMAEGDDSSWNTYYDGSDSKHKGVFLSGRKVKLDPFVISQYEVTQKLYMQVMEFKDANNPSNFLSNVAADEIQENRPVEYITWYKACVFCNELTKETFGNTDQCVYYSDPDCKIPYTSVDSTYYHPVYPAYNTETHKWTKTGYRLPTEAEWEFCARGGDPNALDTNNKSIWNFAYAGVQTTHPGSSFTSTSNYTDTALNDYAWYYGNEGSKTHEVGKKSPNTLGLYDMSGNVYEWCYDWYNSDATEYDAKDTDGYVMNPLVVLANDSSFRCYRGGGYGDNAYNCSVSRRYSYGPNGGTSNLGFRVCRSTN